MYTTHISLTHTHTLIYNNSKPLMDIGKFNFHNHRCDSNGIIISHLVDTFWKVRKTTPAIYFIYVRWAKVAAASSSAPIINKRIRLILLFRLIPAGVFANVVCKWKNVLNYITFVGADAWACLYSRAFMCVCTQRYISLYTRAFYKNII